MQNVNVGLNKMMNTKTFYNLRVTVREETSIWIVSVLGCPQGIEDITLIFHIN